MFLRLTAFTMSTLLFASSGFCQKTQDNKLPKFKDGSQLTVTWKSINFTSVSVQEVTLGLQVCSKDTSELSVLSDNSGKPQKPGPECIKYWHSKLAFTPKKEYVVGKDYPVGLGYSVPAAELNKMIPMVTAKQLKPQVFIRASIYPVPAKGKSLQDGDRLGKASWDLKNGEFKQKSQTLTNEKINAEFLFSVEAVGAKK